MPKCRDHKLLEKIKKFAKKPSIVSWSERAQWEIFSLEGLTKGNILEAVVNYIEGKNPVEEEIMTKHSQHRGKKAYILKPEIEGIRRYIKLQFININDSEKMHVFSAHNQ